MKITIKSTNLKLTSALHDYIEQKINGLERFIKKVGIKDRSFDPSTKLSIKKGKPPFEIWLEVGRTTFHHKKGNVYRAESQIRFSGKSIRSEVVGPDLRIVINEIKDELQREFKKYQKKQMAIYKRGARKFKKSLKFASEAKYKHKKGARIREEGA